MLTVVAKGSRRLAEYSAAKPLYRRALAIDQASLGKDHPGVAIELNNLARSLQATNRLGEADPLMRRALALLLAFQRAAGPAHPHHDAAISNYTGLLAAMGQSEAQIAVAIAALWRETGLEPP